MGRICLENSLKNLACIKQSLKNSNFISTPLTNYSVEHEDLENKFSCILVGNQSILELQIGYLLLSSPI